MALWVLYMQKCKENLLRKKVGQRSVGDITTEVHVSWNCSLVMLAFGSLTEKSVTEL